MDACHDLLNAKHPLARYATKPRMLLKRRLQHEVIPSYTITSHTYLHVPDKSL